MLISGQRRSIPLLAEVAAPSNPRREVRPPASGSARHSSAVEVLSRRDSMIQTKILANLDELKAVIEGESQLIDLKTLKPRDPEKFTKLLSSYSRLLGIAQLFTLPVKPAQSRKPKPRWSSTKG